MTRDQRLRRVLILLCHFTRNLAYYRAGWDKQKLIRKEQFWVGINGNCLDKSILEWCKLFADRKDAHYWKNIVSQQSSFETELYALVGGIDPWHDYILVMREYRDKFVAHLDNELTAHIPHMDDAFIVARHYYEYAAAEATQLGSFSTLYGGIHGFYDAHYQEARNEYQART
jgi:hypothetical protein